MPGPIDVNPDVVKSVDNIAKKVGERADGSAIWQAGPDAKDYNEGEFVPNTYAKRARGVRQRTNAVKSVMRNEAVEESESRERVNRVIEAKRQAQRGEISDEELDAIRRNLVGSP